MKCEFNAYYLFLSLLGLLWKLPFTYFLTLGQEVSEKLSEALTPWL